MNILSAALIAAAVLQGGCRSASPPSVSTDAAILRSWERGGSAFGKGDVEDARDAYMAALTRARMLDDPVAVGHSAYNLATCLYAQGEMKQALALLAEAKADLSRGGVPDYHVRLLQARIALAQGDTESAERLTAEIEESHGFRAASPDTIGWTYAVLARAQHGRGDYDAALQSVLRAESAAGRDRALRAECAFLKALVARGRKQPRAAAEGFDRAAELYQEAGQAERVAASLAAAAAAYRDSGGAGEAASRYYRAGRSLLAQGERDQAAEHLGLALELARETGNGELEKIVGEVMDRGGIPDE